MIIAALKDTHIIFPPKAKQGRKLNAWD